MSNAFELYITQELITYTALWWILCLWLFNFTYVQISCVKYIPLLCWIWPDFKQKSSLFYQQSLGMIQTRVPNSQVTWWQDQNYSSANYIHCPAKLSVKFSQFTFSLTGCFLCEGRHLGKIRLGANVTDQKKGYYLALFCRCRVDLVEIVVILLVIRIQHLVYPLTLSFIPNMMLLKRKASTYTYHFALWITLYTTQLLA